MSMEDFVGDFFGGIKSSKKRTRKSKKNDNGMMMEPMDDFGIPAFNGRFGKVGEGFLENIGELKTGRINFADRGRSQSAISPLFQADFGIKQGPLLRAPRRSKGRRRAAPKARRAKTNGNGKKDERPTVALGTVAGRGIKKGISGLAQRIKERRGKNGKNGTVTFASGLNGNGNGNGKKNGNGNGKKNGNNNNGNGKKNGNNNNGNGERRNG